MARLQMTGFEWQSAGSGFESSVSTGTPTINTTTKYSGAASILMSGSIAASAVKEILMPNFTSAAVCYAKWMVYVDQLTNDPDVVVYMDLRSGSTNVTSVQLYNDGGVLTGTAYYNNFATQTATFTTGLAFDQWIRVEQYYDTSPANGSERMTVRINGVDAITLTNLTYTNKTVTSTSFGIFNGTVGAITDATVYFDDVITNDSSGTFNNTWVGDEKIAIAVPTGAGDNAATAGTFSMINEIPPSNITTPGSTLIELDSNGDIAEYNMTDSTTMGLNSYDNVKAITPMMRMREESAGTSSYQFGIKSASGGTRATSAAFDAGGTAAATNGGFTNRYFSESDPTTGVAWTPTGTNSVDNMQVGILNVDADSTPDIWVLTMAAMVGYTTGSPPSGFVPRIMMV